MYLSLTYSPPLFLIFQDVQRGMSVWHGIIKLRQSLLLFVLIISGGHYTNIYASYCIVLHHTLKHEKYVHSLKFHLIPLMSSK